MMCLPFFIDKARDATLRLQSERHAQPVQAKSQYDTCGALESSRHGARFTIFLAL
jgi:hypothetical protein